MEKPHKKTLESILLVSLRSPFLDDSKIYPPLGLLYLKSAINRELPNVRVDIMDNYDLSRPEIFGKYDAVGASIMTPQRKEAYDLLWAVKKLNPKIPVIAGGPHIKHYLEESKLEAWDYLVPDDGQRSLVKILKGEADRVEFDHMSKDDWARQPNPDRTSPEAVELLNGYNYTLNGRRATTMLTATGCPMACTFCEDALTGTRWRNTSDLAKEMDEIKILGYRGVYIFDDLFAIAMPKVRPIAEELKKRDLIYRCNGQANYFTKWGEDFAKLLAGTGCVEIAFGHESGSQTILDNVHKSTTVEQNYKSVEYAKKHGLKVKSFLMLGLPGENWGTVAETERFIKTSGIDDFQLAIYYPYKGTRIRDALDRGEDIGMTYREGLGAYGQKGGKTESVVGTQFLTSEQLEKARDHLVTLYRPQSHDKFFDTHLEKPQSNFTADTPYWDEP